MIGVVDIGGTKTAVGLVSDDGALVAHDRFPTGAERGFEAAATQVVETLAALVGADRIDGIGIAATGPVDPCTGRFGNVDFLPGWHGKSLVASFQGEFGVDVVVENDADAAAMGEFVWGSGREIPSLLFVTVSTGIGVGYVRDGRIVRDAHGQHPEMGHHIIDADGPSCYCGRGGCWEALASGSAVARIGAEALGIDPSMVDVGDLLAGEGAASTAVRERTSRYLGIGLANLISILRPEAIALGGGVMGSWEFLREGVLETIAENTCDVPSDIRITLAALRPHTALIGAAAAYLGREDSPCP